MKISNSRSITLLTLGITAGLFMNVPEAAATHPGESHYQRVCAECHDKGAKNKLAKGAPRLGDRTGWETRLSKGVDVIYKTLMDNDRHGKKDDVSWEKVNPFIWREDLTEAQIRSALEYLYSEADS